MPARTLSSESELLSPLQYAPFVPSPTFDGPERSLETAAQQPPFHLVNLGGRPYFMNNAQFHRMLGHSEAPYPTAQPMRRTDDVALPLHPSQWPFHPSLAPGWLPHPPMSRAAPMPPPPPVLHKVWIVDCKACGGFLTNRGMKAVLLLRPSVPLYSTDAMPINCSAHAMTAEATASSRASSAPTSSSPPQPPALARTCECLTQTLWCHGCGTPVGYMIVSPCHRCTSSYTSNNRSTNGHRFVFYSAEIVASERHYVPGECGIDIRAQLPNAAPAPAPPPPAPSPPQRPRYTSVTPGTPRAHRNAHALGSPHRRGSVSSNPRDPPHSPSSPRSDVSSSPPPLEPVSPPRFAAEPAQQPRPEPPLLREGGVVFWHHLVRSGEIPAVSDDPRARVPALRETSDTLEDPLNDKEEAKSAAVVPRKMIAGR